MSTPQEFSCHKVVDIDGSRKRISIVGLAGLAPGRQLEAVVHHADSSEDRIRLNHSLNAEQVGWFRAGSALNVLRTR